MPCWKTVQSCQSLLLQGRFCYLNYVSIHSSWLRLSEACTSIHISDCFSGKLSVVYKQQLRHLCVCELKERGNTCSCFLKIIWTSWIGLLKGSFFCCGKDIVETTNSKLRAKKFSNNSDKKLVKLDLHRQLQFSRNYSFPLCLLLVLFSLFPFSALFFFYSSLFDTCMHACIGGLVATPLASVV